MRKIFRNIQRNTKKRKLTKKVEVKKKLTPFQVKKTPFDIIT